MEPTIIESYTLPSKGIIYKEKINPNITLRSMTTYEEMKRLSKSDRPYKVMCDIIDDCLVDKPGISSYDMCLGDYQYLLHRLRTVTYDSTYKMDTLCTFCGKLNTLTIDLDEIEVKSCDESITELFTLTLPKTKKVVSLNYQTPRSIDNINIKKAEFTQRTNNDTLDQSMLYTMQSIIDTVDNVKLDPIKSEMFIRNLPLADTNAILKRAEKINNAIGINTKIYAKCNKCRLDYTTSFRITSEFFGPTYDE